MNASRLRAFCTGPDSERASRIRITLAAVAIALAVVATPVRVAARQSAPAQSSDSVPDLERVQKAFTDIVERVSPSVVGLRAHRAQLTAAGDTSAAARIVGQRVAINGSGTVLDADGYVLTNEHVIQSSETIEVYYHDGKSGTAIVVASDARSDLAILKVDRRGLPAARLCEWKDVARGQWTIAIGNPFGLGGDGKLSVSTGVISNLGRKLPGLGEVDDRLYNDMIQTTAAINPGNSGGPLFNIRGELIGIVTAMHTRAAADEGVGFAIPITQAKRRMIEQLRQGRPIEYGYLGMSARNAEGYERRALGISDEIGAVVDDIEPDGPAARAGIREGDFVARFASEQVRDSGHLVELVGGSSIGQSVPLELLRGKERLTIPVTVEKRQVSRVASMRGGAILWRGMRLADLSADAKQRMQVGDGAKGVLVIDVARDSAAAKAGIRIGDVIERVLDAAASDIAAFRQRVRGESGPLKVKVRGRGELMIQP